MKIINSISLNEVFEEIEQEMTVYKCEHYELKNEGNEGYGRCVKCGEEVRIY